jgi:hypothetical protein
MTRFARETEPMMRLLVAVAILAALSAQPGRAQSADECVLSALNITETKYPCVYADHRVLFGVVTPDAQEVRVRVGPGFDLAKGPDGIWSATTPLIVGFQSHQWLSWRRAFTDFAPRLFK